MRRKNSLIWTGAVFLVVIAVVFAGCLPNFTGTGRSEADSLSEEHEQTNAEIIPGIIAPEKPETENPGEEVKIDTRLTIGGKYSETLVEEGSRNILIIGEDKVSWLYDTIGIFSVDSENKQVKIIMIPRDTYIEYNSPIINKLKSQNLYKEPGIFKINYAHHIGTLIEYDGKFNTQSASFLAEVIHEKFDIEIDDYVKVNLAGFTGIVDTLGGVDINVPYDMNYEDPIQDLYIHLSQGQQHLNGSQAEGFVRFRKGTKNDGTPIEVGDEARKNNQITLIKAIIKQHGTVTNINKIPKILSILGNNVKHSIGVGEILQTYIKLGIDIVSDKYEITSQSLNSKQIRINGSAYIDVE